MLHIEKVYWKKIHAGRIKKGIIFFKSYTKAWFPHKILTCFLGVFVLQHTKAGESI